jgi:hypothetical protein
MAFTINLKAEHRSNVQSMRTDQLAGHRSFPIHNITTHELKFSNQLRNSRVVNSTTAWRWNLISSLYLHAQIWSKTQLILCIYVQLKACKVSCVRPSQSKLPNRFR